MTRDTADPEVRARILDEGLALIRNGMSPGVAFHTAGQKYGASRATVYRWYRAIEGLPREDWVNALTPNYKGRVTGIPEHIYQRFCELYDKTHPPSLRKAYRQLTEEYGDDIPSESALRHLRKARGEKTKTRYD